MARMLIRHDELTNLFEFVKAKEKTFYAEHSVNKKFHQMDDEEKQRMKWVTYSHFIKLTPFLSINLIS
jgi:hypothetical protein